MPKIKIVCIFVGLLSGVYSGILYLCHGVFLVAKCVRSLN